jgi:hypothetical protein
LFAFNQTHAKPFLPATAEGNQLPIQFGHAFAIRPLDWSDFPGQVDERLPWSAHIFWSIEYKITDVEKRKVSVNLLISKRSWVRT